MAGAGEPLVLLQTALTADELRAVSQQPQIRDHYRLIQPRRRGYAGSSATGPGSIPRDADDAAHVLAHLGIAGAHVVGVSYSAAVALQLAVTEPRLVHTLCLIEPPPLQVASAEEFRAACRRLIAQYRQEGAAATLEDFMSGLAGPEWRADLEQAIPGAVAATERDAPTFFESDLAALLAWRFSRTDASRIHQPVLYVGASDSGPWFAAVRELMLAWLPQAEDVVVPHANHSLAVTHAPQVAAALADFLRRHPLRDDRRRSSRSRASGPRTG